MLIGTAPAAHAHAERVGSKPEEGAALASAPTEVSVDFTEPPTADARFEVFDGCGTDVVDELDIQGLDITASLGEAQPGRWKVEFHVVSGVDGHDTRDSFSFSVKGKPDCPEEREKETDSEGPRAAPDDGGGASGTLILVGALTVVLVGGAIVLRMRGA